MKIVIVGFEYFHYCRSLVNACRVLGYEVLYLEIKDYKDIEQQSWRKQAVKLGYKYFEKEYEKSQEERFIKTISEFKPDVCIAFNGLYIPKGLLLAMQKQNVKRILFLADTIQGDGFRSVVPTLPLYNCIFSYESTDCIFLSKQFPDVKYMFLGYDEKLFFPSEQNLQKEIDISFIGTAIPNRLEILEAVSRYAHDNKKKLVIHIRPIFKEHHILHKIKNYFKRNKFRKNFPYFSKYAIEKPIYNQALVDVYRKSRICLNIHSSEDMHTDANPRTFEILGCKSFQLVDCNHLKNVGIMPGHHLVEFKDSDDLCKKIDYYLQHIRERETIAISGYEIAKKEYTMSRAVKKMLEIAGIDK